MSTDVITYDASQVTFTNNTFGSSGTILDNYSIIGPAPSTDPFWTNQNNGCYWNGVWYYGFNHHTCGCHCLMCLAVLIAALTPKPQPEVFTAPPAASTSPVVDAVLKQARDRIAEIQKRLDEVPALTSEIERLKKIVDAGG